MDGRLLAEEERSRREGMMVVMCSKYCCRLHARIESLAALGISGLRVHRDLNDFDGYLAARKVLVLVLELCLKLYEYDEA